MAETERYGTNPLDGITGTWLPYIGATGWGFAATVIAATSSVATMVSNFAQALHDANYPIYVCDGTADEIEINEAIDALE